MSTPTELRVFVSSTFRDLQGEREHLVKKVFPEIRSLCRRRGITFTEVDLRWGLTQEDQVLGQVIRTCLEEIDRCRPYFIAITGDRYGYVPQLHEYYKDPDLLRQYPWIEDAVVEEASIIDLEFRHAALNDPANARESARFYFRQHESDTEKDVDEGDRLRLERLKERVRRAGLPVEEYREPGELGDMVYRELCAIIDRDFAGARVPTPLEEERARHEAFAASRRHAYIPNAEYIATLNRYIEGEGPPLVVFGESGSGKSALVSYWAGQYRRRHPEAQVVEHYVGIGAGATDHLAVMWHVMAEIRERFDRREEIPSSPREIEGGFANWLGFVQGCPLIVILDGVNQLQGAALNLAWLPKEIPANIRLIVTSTVEQALTALRERGWREMGVQPLTVAECEAAIVRYLAEYRKSLSSEQVRRIAEDRKSGSPLFLRTLLEELRLYGSHELLDRRIEYLLGTIGTEELFQRVLERLEEDHGAQAVEVVMTHLWGTRSGLSEGELSEMTDVSRMRLSGLVLGLDYHLVRRDGLLTFFHDYLRRAVEMRYLLDGERRRRVHLDLARYFERQPASQRTSRELLWALERAGERDRLAGSLSTIEHFMMVHQGETEYEVLRYWTELAETYDAEEMYRRGLERWRPDGDRDRVMVLGRIADLLTSLGRWEGAMELHREQLRLAVECGDRVEEAKAHKHLGALLVMQGEYDEAFRELAGARAIFTEYGDRGGLSSAIGNMGLAYSNRGEYDRALECYREQEEICRELGDRRGLAQTIGNMGIVHNERGEYDRALECYREQEEICRELGDRRGLAQTIGNMGTVYVRLGEMDRALECFRRQEEIGRELGDRREAAYTSVNMGTIYLNLGEYDRALECYRQAETISRELGERRVVAYAVVNMGTVHGERGEYDRALECYRQAETISREMGARATLSRSLDDLARMLLELVEDAGEMPEYLPLYVPGLVPEEWRATTLRRARELAEECLAISEELSKPDTLFSSEILLARITGAEGHPDVAAGRLLELLPNVDDDDLQAELHYRLWKLGAGGDDHGGRALQLYRRLFERTPNDDYRRRIEELASLISTSLG